jgi:hypothetical protein
MAENGIFTLDRVVADYLAFEEYQRLTLRALVNGEDAINIDKFRLEIIKKAIEWHKKERPGIGIEGVK